MRPLLLHFTIVVDDHPLFRQGVIDSFSLEEDGIILLASGNGQSDAMRINQDASMYVGRLQQGGELTHPLQSKRHAWLQLISGALAVNGVQLGAGDACALSGEEAVEIAAKEESEFLLFDLA